MRAEIVKRGCSPGDMTSFRMLSAAPVGVAEAAQAQTVEGFSPVGYSGPWGLRCERQADGWWISTWSCAGSCD